jgi:Pectate lyase superfamily protein
MKTRQLLFVLFLVKMYDANSAVTQEPVLCNGEDIPVIQQGELTCAFDVGIKPDTGADLSTSITTALAQYTYGLYFPAGEYIINNNILLHQNNNMVGSKVGITHLKSTNFDSTPQIGQPDYGYNPVASNLVIQNLILDNVIPYHIFMVRKRM